MTNKKVVFLLGPTSSGKTNLSIKLAQMFKGEIVNIDSQQAIKGLDIATNKITTGEMQGIKHYMLDIYDLKDTPNVWDFSIRAEKLIKQISKSGKLPIVVGGTGLYARVLSGGISLSEDDSIGKALRIKLDHMQLKTLIKRAKKLDVYANLNESDKYNKRRLIRVIEKEITSSNKSRHFLEGYDTLKLALDKPLDLGTKIQKNVTHMVKKGLVDETKMLHKKYPDFAKKVKAIGYKETLQYIKGEIKSEEELVELITTHSRQYAKRQMTWLRKEPGLVWIKTYQKAKARVAAFLEE